MPHFRTLKALIRAWLAREDWTPANPLPPECSEIPPISIVQPLFACLPEGGEMTDRAAQTLGMQVAKVYSTSPEDAKNIIRRFMWHMNEESGNIGWGIPEAFGETLAQCPPLADAFRRVLLHYVYDAPEDKSTAFCDYAPLRISCYKAIARLLAARPEFAEEALPLLRSSAENETDHACREAACALVRTHMLTPFRSPV